MKVTFGKFFGAGCALWAIIGITVITCWIVNFVKFTKCDFKEPYKYEIIHGIGLFPGASIVTVWWGNEPPAAETKTETNTPSK